MFLSHQVADTADKLVAPTMGQPLNTVHGTALNMENLTRSSAVPMEHSTMAQFRI